MDNPKNTADEVIVSWNPAPGNFSVQPRIVGEPGESKPMEPARTFRGAVDAAAQVLNLVGVEGAVTAEHVANVEVRLLQSKRTLRAWRASADEVRALADPGSVTTDEAQEARGGPVFNAYEQAPVAGFAGFTTIDGEVTSYRTEDGMDVEVGAMTSPPPADVTWDGTAEFPAERTDPDPVADDQQPEGDPPATVEADPDVVTFGELGDPERRAVLAMLPPGSDLAEDAEIAQADVKAAMEAAANAVPDPEADQGTTDPAAAGELAGTPGEQASGAGDTTGPGNAEVADAGPDTVTDEVAG